MHVRLMLLTACWLAGCRDVIGHGSHTAATAAGNRVSVTSAAFTGNVSGVAPGAHIAMYKVMLICVAA